MNKKIVTIICSVLAGLVLIVSLIYGMMYLSVKDIIADLKNVLNERAIVDKTNEEILKKIYMCEDSGDKLDYLNIHYLYTIHNFNEGKIVVKYDSLCESGTGGADFLVELYIKKEAGKWVIKDYANLNF